MGERGAWIGVAAGSVGWVVTALVVLRGGGYFVVVPHLAYWFPLAVVGTVTALCVLGVGHASVNAVGWFGVIAVAGFAANFLVYSCRFGNSVWSLLLPLAHPMGIDFRDGLYEPARAFSTLRSGWPPPRCFWGGRSRWSASRPVTWSRSASSSRSRSRWRS